MALPQPDIKGPPEPHHITVMSDHIFAFVGSGQDTMHLEEFLSQPDRGNFIKAMKKELKNHINRGRWKVIQAKHVTKDKILLLMVWTMKINGTLL